VPEPDVISRARLHRKLANNLQVQQVPERLAELEAAEAALGPATTERDQVWWSEWLEIQLTRMWTFYWGAKSERIDETAAQVRPALEAHGSLQQRGNFFRCLANASLIRAEYVGTEQSVSYIRTALAGDQEAGNLRQIATDQFMLGMHLLWLGKRDEAEAELKHSHELAEQVGDAWIRTIALAYRTVCCRFRGSLKETRECAEQTLEIAARSGLEIYVALARFNLAWIAWRQGDLAEAETSARSGLAEAEHIKLLPFRWLAALPLLDIALAHGDNALALYCARQMLGPVQQRLPAALDAPIRTGLGASESGADEQAFAAYRQALDAARDLAYI
jgi:hypothetical protein